MANLQQELEHNGNQVKSIMESTKDGSNAGEIIPDYIPRVQNLIYSSYYS